MEHVLEKTKTRYHSCFRSRICGVEPSILRRPGWSSQPIRNWRKAGLSSGELAANSFFVANLSLLSFGYGVFVMDFEWSAGCFRGNGMWSLFPKQFTIKECCFWPLPTLRLMKSSQSTARKSQDERLCDERLADCFVMIPRFSTSLRLAFFFSAWPAWLCCRRVFIPRKHGASRTLPPALPSFPPRAMRPGPPAREEGFEWRKGQCMRLWKTF